MSFEHWISGLQHILHGWDSAQLSLALNEQVKTKGVMFAWCSCVIIVIRILNSRLDWIYGPIIYFLYDLELPLYCCFEGRQTWQFSWVTPGVVLSGIIRGIHKGPYGILGIETRLAICKTTCYTISLALSSLLNLCLSFFFLKMNIVNIFTSLSYYNPK